MKSEHLQPGGADLQLVCASFLGGFVFHNLLPADFYSLSVFSVIAFQHVRMAASHTVE